MRLKLPSSEQFLYMANVLVDRLFFKQGYGADVKSILVVKWDEIGDMATATHVFKLLKNEYPQAKITLLCKNFVKSLIENDPFIDEVITDITAYNKSYDLELELRGTWSTLFRSLRFKGKYRTSRAEVRLKNKGKQLHEIATNAAVVASVTHNTGNAMPQLYYSESDKNAVEEFIKQHSIGRYAVFHIGARRVLRQWPLERFALLAEFVKTNFQLAIVFAGTKEDEQHINAAKAQLPFETFSFTEGFSLSQFSYLCSGASLFIGNESGPLHIASAFGIPLVGLYGPGVPDVFYPLGENSRILHHVLSCNPCNQIDCVVPENPCIQRITVLDVSNELLNLKDKINL
ncbi:MAG: glycosyltransferase family 9 protein [Bacteroidota bacterium]